MSTRFFFVAVLTACFVSAAWAEQAPPRAMVLGVFHFANPGQDVIQTDQIDVLKPERQTYLAGLALTYRNMQSPAGGCW
jgi:hypothetical protein